LLFGCDRFRGVPLHLVQVPLHHGTIESTWTIVDDRQGVIFRLNLPMNAARPVEGMVK